MNVNNTANTVNSTQPVEHVTGKPRSSVISLFGEFFSNLGSTASANQADVSVRRDSPVANRTSQEQNRRSQQPNDVNRRSNVNNERNTERSAERSGSRQQPESAGSETVSSNDEARSTVSEAVAAEREAIRDIADVLGISAEQLAEIMMLLGLTVLDLTDKQNVDKLLLTVFNMERPSDLLNLSGIVGMFNDIKEVTSDFSEMIENVDFSELKAELLDLKSNLSQNGNAPNPEQLFAAVAEEAVKNPILASLIAAEGEVAKAATQNVTPLESEAETMEEFLHNLQETEAQISLRAEHQASTGSGQQQENPLMGGEQAVNAMPIENKLPGQAFNNAFELTTMGQTVKAETVQARPPTSINDIINQMLEKMKVDVRANISEVRMTLNPESLGDVSLKIVTERGIVTAMFLAENERVKEIIESNFNILKDSLEKQGIAISSLSVEVGSEKGQHMQEEFEKGRHLSAERIRQIMGTEAEEDDELGANVQHAEGNEVNYYA